MHDIKLVITDSPENKTPTEKHLITETVIWWDSKNPGYLCATCALNHEVTQKISILRDLILCCDCLKVFKVHRDNSQYYVNSQAYGFANKIYCIYCAPDGANQHPYDPDGFSTCFTCGCIINDTEEH